MTTRRKAIRNGVLLAFGMMLAKYDVAKAQGRVLTVDLEPWANIVFKHKGQEVVVTPADIFAAMKELV